MPLVSVLLGSDEIAIVVDVYRSRPPGTVTRRTLDGREAERNYSGQLM